MKGTERAIYFMVFFTIFMAVIIFKGDYTISLIDKLLDFVGVFSAIGFFACISIQIFGWMDTVSNNRE